MVLLFSTGSTEKIRGSKHPAEEMFSLTVGGVAIGLAFFLFRSSVCFIEEYTPLYLTQIGYSAAFVGLAPILGLFTQTFGIPSLSYLADKFRARKLFLFLSILISIPSTLLFLAVPIPEPICDETKGNVTISYNTIVAPLALNKTDSSHNVSSLSDVEHDVHGEKRLTFFIVFIILRGIFELSKRLTVTLITVAAMAHLKQDKSKFGNYACWGEIGGGLALFVGGITLSHVSHYVCGELVPDYLIIFFFVVGYQVLTLVTLPFMNFEYLEHRVIDYQEVKEVLTTPHYILILVICSHCGACSAFQTRWEFWYMAKLGGSSTVMAVGGLLRRPIVAAWFLLSRHIIGHFGELNIIALSLFVFTGSFFGLAFIENAWFVILLDNFQAAAFTFSFASFVIHFSNVGSKASTAFFQGKV